MRDSFIFYRSFYEALNELPDKEQLKVYKAISEYSLNFNEIELTGIAKTIFILIKPQLDANIQRYKNGTKPKKKQKVSKTEAKYKQNISRAETNVNVNDNLNDNSNENKNNNINHNKIIYDLYPSKCHSGRSTGKSKNKDLEKITKLLKDYSVEHLTKVIEWYIDDCKKTNTYLKNFSTFLNNIPDIPQSESVEEKKKFIKYFKYGMTAQYIPIEQWDRFYNMEKEQITSYKEVLK